MNQKTRIALAATAIAGTVTMYACQELRIRILKKQLIHTATHGLLTANVLRHAVDGMTEAQADAWLKNLSVELTFQDIISNQS
jgi:uncharacterized protein with FMN-binding domain